MRWAKALIRNLPLVPSLQVIGPSPPDKSSCQKGVAGRNSHQHSIQHLWETLHAVKRRSSVSWLRGEYSRALPEIRQKTALSITKYHT